MTLEFDYTTLLGAAITILCLVVNMILIIGIITENAKILRNVETEWMNYQIVFGTSFANKMVPILAVDMDEYTICTSKVFHLLRLAETLRVKCNAAIACLVGLFPMVAGFTWVTFVTPTRKEMIELALLLMSAWDLLNAYFIYRTQKEWFDMAKFIPSTVYGPSMDKDYEHFVDTLRNVGASADDYAIRIVNITEDLHHDAIRILASAGWVILVNTVIAIAAM